MENVILPTGNIGKKIMKIRKMRDMKQETLGNLLGISRQAVSKLEQSESIEDEKLAPVAKALGLSVDDLKNFNEDATINYIQNNYEGSIKDANNFFVSTNHDCTFNPLDKCMELAEKNEKLYEQLLQSEREKVAMMQKFLDKK